MNKNISQAAKSIVDANKKLQDLLGQINSLKIENTNLKKALSDTKRELERLKTQTGKSTKKVIKNLKVKNINGKVKITAISYHDTAIARQREAEMRGMDAESKRNYWKNRVFIPQLIDRLHIYFGPEWDYSWDDDIRRALETMSVEEANYIVKFMGLDKMYYESDSAWSGGGSTENLTAREIYNYIVWNVQAVNPDFKTTGILPALKED